MKVQKKPTWDDVKNPNSFDKLTKDREADVVIVGGGLAGILSAYLLSQSGKKVVIVEKERIGMGATGVTTAFLTQFLDTSPSELIDLFGKKIATLATDSHGKAISLIEKIAKKEKIKCEFTRCSLIDYINSDSGLKTLQEDGSAAQALGMPITFHKKIDRVK